MQFRMIYSDFFFLLLKITIIFLLSLALLKVPD